MHYILIVFGVLIAGIVEFFLFPDAKQTLADLSEKQKGVVLGGWLVASLLIAVAPKGSAGA